MSIKKHFVVRSAVLKGHVNKYAMLGLIISIASIVVATLLVSYQLVGTISFEGITQAQLRNPAIWALDLTPFMFAYWGQSFCYELASKAELIIEDKTREYESKSGDLELKLKYEGNHDSLTNLPNNKLLSERINQGIKQLAENEELAVIILNINNFKEINYYFGGFSGNSLLMQFSEKLKSILLEPYMLQAYMGMNMVARLQGAEFAILIPRLKKEHNLELILMRVVEATSTSFMIDGNNIQISTTAGVALYPQHGDNDQTLLHHGTLCLLHAEKEGKSYAIYAPAMDKYYKTKRIILKELSSAIENEKLDLLFDPVCSLADKQPVAAVAEIQYNDPQYGVVSAEKLIQLVEGSSLVHNLTVFCFKNAIKQLAIWRKQKPDLMLRLTLINIQNRDLPRIVENLLQDNHLPANCLTLELSEKACLSEQKNSIDILGAFHDLGVRVAISDFASGYSSFLYLNNFPIDEIKIDPSFIVTMLKDEKKHRTVQAIIQLASAMKVAVFADGINDDATAKELLKMGCNLGEGPYFKEALTAKDFENLLSKGNNQEESHA